MNKLNKEISNLIAQKSWLKTQINSSYGATISISPSKAIIDIYLIDKKLKELILLKKRVEKIEYIKKKIKDII